MALFEVSDDIVNGTGWREDVFRVAAVITGSHFAEPSGFDAQVQIFLLVSSMTAFGEGSLYRAPCVSRLVARIDKLAVCSQPCIRYWFVPTFLSSGRGILAFFVWRALDRKNRKMSKYENIMGSISPTESIVGFPPTSCVAVRSVSGVLGRCGFRAATLPIVFVGRIFPSADRASNNKNMFFYVICACSPRRGLFKPLSKMQLSSLVLCKP